MEIYFDTIFFIFILKVLKSVFRFPLFTFS